MNVTVVVPTYNERDNIARLVNVLQEVFRENRTDGRIMVVDDSSPDGTAQIVRELRKKNTNVTLYVRAERRGIGAAYKFAFPMCKTQYVVEMDADFSHDPRELPRFLDKLEKGYDLVVGSRYVKGGARLDPFYRRVFPVVGNWLYRKLLGFPVTDTTSGYRAFRASALAKIKLSRLPNDFSFQSAMIYEFMRAGRRVGEVPISFRKREAGTPKYAFKDLLGNIALLLRLFFFGRA
ncbi:MAG: polyprenol monophosphomannose synthase [Candidatus Aenigmatarchaeota archaeon]|nr:MAG: polyprenol monophosphomannose synthase [Candidatus Aenigmarchaeota archaeon]